MRLKHHILLYTFLSVAVLLSIYLALDYGIQAQRSAQALEDAYAQRVLETQEHLQRPWPRTRAPRWSCSRASAARPTAW